MSDNNTQPSAPDISAAELRQQFWLDIFGKEVQSAATYSYLWIADQAGHVGLGIVAQFLLTALLELFGLESNASLWSMIGICVIVAVWEVAAYRQAANRATERFPLNREGLAANAKIATAYMCLGAILGFGFHLVNDWYMLAVLIGVIALAIWWAPPWLRQKIIWQRASLPYLFRLADARPTIDQATADQIQALLEEAAPPAAAPRQIIIFGDIGTGRTSLCAGIGTEFAFRNRKARYLSFDKLSEMAVTGEEYRGPRNINYWPWRESQVLLIDDILPSLPQITNSKEQLEAFKQKLDATLHGEPWLSNRHTVWVVGDAKDQHQQGWIERIKTVCSAQAEPIVARLHKIK